MTEPATAVFALADDYVERVAALDPLTATYAGIGGHDHALPRLDPDWHDERARLDRDTLAALAAIDPTTDSPADALARLVLTERLGVALDQHEAGQWRCDLNIIASPLQALVEVIDLADTSDGDGRAELWARLEAVPKALEGFRTSLEAGLACGDIVARRQVERCIEQTRARGGRYLEAVAHLDDAGLTEAATRAGAAYEHFGRWLTSDYLASARVDDAVGIDRYRLAQRVFLGADPDPRQSYDWGWTRVLELREEMARLAAEILPGAGLAEVLDHLEHHSDFAVTGIEAFRDWAQNHVDSMIDVFGRDHFDLAPPLRVCEVRVSPAGGSTAAHYTGPSEDGARPGIYWQPDLSRERYPLWDQVTTANHEAVPGHHLQIAQVVLGGAPLSRFQRTLCWISGHGEGWALYAERLCAELGLLDRPEAMLGYLAAAQLRAVRVVIDIGVHCGFALPADAPMHAGEQWSWQTAFDLVRGLTGGSEVEMASEVDRYFGWAGQAPSYALGEREWLAARDAARDAAAAAGRSFDLKAFHTAALNLGSVGLDVLRNQVVVVART